MPNYSMDSSVQVADYAGLIWKVNVAIVDCNVYGNYSAIPGLVDNLETILYPHFDPQYKKEIEIINKIKPRAASTMRSKRASLNELNNKKMLLTHRALMDLAYRKHFLPAGTGTSGKQPNGFILEAGDM